MSKRTPWAKRTRAGQEREVRELVCKLLIAESCADLLTVQESDLRRIPAGIPLKVIREEVEKRIERDEMVLKTLTRLRIRLAKMAGEWDAAAEIDVDREIERLKREGYRPQ